MQAVAIAADQNVPYEIIQKRRAKNQQGNYSKCEVEA